MVDHYRFRALREEMIWNHLVAGLADVTLSERLQMDPNLTLQRAIESARNAELVKRQQGTIRSIVKSYEIEAMRSETSGSSKDKGCPVPMRRGLEVIRGASVQLTTVVVLKVAI